MLNWIKHHKKSLIILILLLSSVAIAPRLLNKEKEKPTTARVERKTVRQAIAASGKINAKSQVDLKFQTSGKLVWVGVKEGDTVKKWQAIASLDKRDIEYNIRKKLLAYQDQRWDFEQTQGDYKTKKDQYLLTESEKRILDKTQFSLDSAVVDVEIAALAKEYANLICPISGIVTRIDTPITGVNITPATAVFTIADPNSMIFEANIDEVDIPKISLGVSVDITLDSYPDTDYKGVITYVGFSAVSTSGGGTAYPTEISLPVNENNKFKIGMNGDIVINIRRLDDVLVVPNSAIVNRDNKQSVWRVQGDQFIKTDIVTGLQDDNYTQIISGLSENDIVVSKNVSKISN